MDGNDSKIMGGPGTLRLYSRVTKRIKAEFLDTSEMHYSATSNEFKEYYNHIPASTDDYWSNDYLYFEPSMNNSKEEKPDLGIKDRFSRT